MINNWNFIPSISCSFFTSGWQGRQKRARNAAKVGGQRARGGEGSSCCKNNPSGLQVLSGVGQKSLQLVLARREKVTTFASPFSRKGRKEGEAKRKVGRNGKPSAGASEAMIGIAAGETNFQKFLFQFACKGGKSCRIFALPTGQQAGAGKARRSQGFLEKQPGEKKKKKIWLRCCGMKKSCYLCTPKRQQV